MSIQDSHGDLEEGPVFLPGDLPPRARLHRMLRVDQAGEHGAVRIYGGQSAVLRVGKTAELIKHMAEQEQVHYSSFNDMLRSRSVRPSFFAPFWHRFGYGLGLGTARMGVRAAMACTVGVEEVIDRHYAHQLEWLRKFGQEEELCDTIERFQAEELEHRDIGLEGQAEQTAGYATFIRVIKAFSRLAIRIAERW